MQNDVSTDNSDLSCSGGEYLVTICFDPETYKTLGEYQCQKLARTLKKTRQYMIFA